MRALRTLRLLAPVAWLIIAGFYAGSVAAADVDWSGSWETKWRDGGARLDLKQSGSVVKGTYPLYDGEVEALASGRELTGKWMAGPRSGSFTFVMGLEGRTFVGRYDNGEWWTGARVSGAAPTLPIAFAPSYAVAISPGPGWSRILGPRPPS